METEETALFIQTEVYKKNYSQILEQQWRALFNLFIIKEFQLLLWIKIVHKNDSLFHNESQ